MCTNVKVYIYINTHTHVYIHVCIHVYMALTNDTLVGAVLHSSVATGFVVASFSVAMQDE